MPPNFGAQPTRAARAVGVPFVLVALENAAPAWAAVADLIAAAGGFAEPL